MFTGKLITKYRGPTWPLCIHSLQYFLHLLFLWCICYNWWTSSPALKSAVDTNIDVLCSVQSVGFGKGTMTSVYHFFLRFIYWFWREPVHVWGEAGWRGGRARVSGRLCWAWSTTRDSMPGPEIATCAKTRSWALDPLPHQAPRVHHFSLVSNSLLLS